MRLITRQTLANDVVLKWEQTYASGKYGQDKIRILRSLKQLGQNPNPDDVDAIIGNKSWTRTTCDECGVTDVDVVEIGESPDYDSSAACICKDCLRKACEL